MLAKDQQKPISRSYALKGDDVPKTNKTNILVYALKSDDGEKPTKPISRSYAIKGDDVPKTKQDQYPCLCRKKR